jgi:hypothetical protein
MTSGLSPDRDDLLNPDFNLPSNTSSIYTNFSNASFADISPANEDPAVISSSSQHSKISAHLSLSTSKSAPHPCKICGIDASYVCTACGLDGPRYCSKECQIEDWKVEHHLTCKAKQIDTEQTDGDCEGGSGQNQNTGHKVLTRGNIAQLINIKRELICHIPFVWRNGKQII